MPAIADSVLPIVAAKRAEVVGATMPLDDYVRLLPTPGHTPGHFSVLGRQDRRGGRDHRRSDPLAAAGALSRAVDAVDFDRDLQARTRRAFLERFCDTGTLCCTAHFPSPSAGRIAPWGEGFRCDPVAS